MKKRFILLLAIVFAISSEKAYSQSDPNLQAILALNESQFVNKPLDSIISYLPAGFISIKVRSGGHYYTAKFISILYPNRVWIDLYVEDFNHLNPVDPNRNWDIMLMRKEKLDRISVYQRKVCYKGCAY